MWKAPMTGWQPPGLMTCFAGIHRKGAGCPVDIRLARTEAGAKTVT